MGDLLADGLLTHKELRKEQIIKLTMVGLRSRRAIQMESGNFGLWIRQVNLLKLQIAQPESA